MQGDSPGLSYNGVMVDAGSAMPLLHTPGEHPSEHPMNALLNDLLPLIASAALVAGNVPRVLATDPPDSVATAIYNDTMRTLARIEEELKQQVLIRIHSTPREEVENVVLLVEGQMGVFRVWVEMTMLGAGFEQRSSSPSEEAPAPVEEVASAPMGFGGVRFSAPAVKRPIGFKPN